MESELCQRGGGLVDADWSGSEGASLPRQGFKSLAHSESRLKPTHVPHSATRFNGFEL
jgi:hypothetical protein